MPLKEIFGDPEGGQTYVNKSRVNKHNNNCPIERIGDDCKETSFKFVGIKIDEFLQYKDHIKSVKAKLSSATFALSKVKNLLPENTKLTIYNSLFKSHLEYCNIAWGKANTSMVTEIQSLQKKKRH